MPLGGTMINKLLILIVFLLFSSHNAVAQTNLLVSRGGVSAMPIAITQLQTPQPADSAVANDIRGVIEDDLVNTGLFRSINPQAFIDTQTGIQAIPQFPSWKQIEAQAVTMGTVTSTGSTVSVQVRLWDVATNQQFAGKSFSAPRNNWRRIAHMVADEIYTRLAGEGPYFDTRIVYIAESGGIRSRSKRLAIMDQDSANHQYLTSGSSMVLTPRFDKQSQRIIYMAYYGRTPSVYLYNLETGHEEMLGKFPGMSFAPRFSPDGRKAIMSVSNRGNIDIVELDLASRSTRRVTAGGGIDTSPSYAPDMRQIVFNSDRGGSQQLYVMEADGSNIRRISFGKGRYGSPEWSPRGDLIAFTKMSGGKFFIGVMKPDGSGERLLTESYLDEGPTWAPNGRVIMFSRKNPNRGEQLGETFLYSVDLTGRNLRRVKTPMEGSDPAWSPLLSIR
jgi:TolB protein